MGRTDFSDQFRKIILRHKRIDYDWNFIRQSVRLEINLITIANFAALFICTPWIGRQTLRWPRPNAIHFSWLGPGLFRLLPGLPGFS